MTRGIRICHSTIGMLTIMLWGCGAPVRQHTTCTPNTGNAANSANTDAETVSYTAVVLTSNFETSSLTTLDLQCPETSVSTNHVIASGDAALRATPSQTIVINRGNNSSVMLLNADFHVVHQVALDQCGAHDALPLNATHALITCYNDTALRVVDWAQDAIVARIDLSEFVHADDADGLPEMDAITAMGDMAYVTLQHLDRRNGWQPLHTGDVVAIDTRVFPPVVHDVDAATPGTQPYPLPCSNPFTQLVPHTAGPLTTVINASNPNALSIINSLWIGCAGSFQHPGHGAIATLDPNTGSSRIVADENHLGGRPLHLALDGQGVVHAIIDVVPVDDPFRSIENRVVRYDATVLPTPATETNANTATKTDADVIVPADPWQILYRRAGFSLSGLAIDRDGRVYVGDRSATEHAGLWRIDPRNGEQLGPIATGLPPSQITIIPTVAAPVATP